ncbi:hypothetical protein ACQUY5_27110 [Bacillus cereus]|uniref:hypothetical protein n=1 Tax=Bacillus cereus TaxID=1396 RepID=UPI003D180605
MKVSREEVIRQVNELAGKDAKFAFYLNRVGGDFHKLPEFRQVVILNKLGIKRNVVISKTFKNTEGKRITEEDFMLSVRTLAETNQIVATALENSFGDYFNIPLTRRRKIEDELNMKATQVKAISYERER